MTRNENEIEPAAIVPRQTGATLLLSWQYGCLKQKIVAFLCCLLLLLLAKTNTNKYTNIQKFNTNLNVLFLLVFFVFYINWIEKGKPQ